MRTPEPSDGGTALAHHSLITRHGQALEAGLLVQSEAEAMLLDWQTGQPRWRIALSGEVAVPDRVLPVDALAGDSGFVAGGSSNVRFIDVDGQPLSRLDLGTDSLFRTATGFLRSSERAVTIHDTVGKKLRTVRFPTASRYIVIRSASCRRDDRGVRRPSKCHDRRDRALAVSAQAARRR